MRWLQAVSFVLFTAACSESIPTAPMKNLQLFGPGASTFTVSGTAWIFENGTRHESSLGYVFGWVAYGPGNSGEATGMLRLRSRGQFSFAVGNETGRVWIMPAASGYQPCLATALVTGNLAIDVFYVKDPSLLGVNLPKELTDLGPTLSGTVYEETPSGRKPVPNAGLYLDGLYGHDLVVATTKADAEGRFMFCNMQDLPSIVVAAGADGFEFFQSELGVAKNKTLDIELKRR